MEYHQQPEHEQLYILNDQEQLYFHNEQDNNIKSSIPPGYRFVPDDVELIDDYLKVIVSNPRVRKIHGIYAVNLYGSGPDELTAGHTMQCENQWYFFTQRNRKYKNGSRPDRAAGNGYWKQTNVVQPIYRGANEKKVKIGRKITLDYYSKTNSPDQGGTRTDWKMNEYRLDGEKLPQNGSAGTTAEEFFEWCLCRVYRSKTAKTTNNNSTQVTPQVTGAPSSNTQLIATQEHNEHVTGEQDTNFTRQGTEASFSDQHIIAQQQYNGHNAAGPGLNFVQQRTHLQYSNNDFWNPNISNYVTDATSGSMNGIGSMNGMHYNTDNLLINQQDIYPMFGTMPENAGYVQPIRSFPSGVEPMSSHHSNINQSSSSIPDHVISDWGYNLPPLPPSGNDSTSSSHVEFTFDDFN